MRSKSVSSTWFPLGLRDACEELADDVRELSALLHALRGTLAAEGMVKGGV